MLVALRRIAEGTSCTIVGVRHIRKSGASDARDAGVGSVAWTAVARVEFVVGRDPDDEALRVLAQSKNNLAPEAGPLAYRIVPDDEHGRTRHRRTQPALPFGQPLSPRPRAR